ncbi:MAG: hypothetical protein ACRDTM_01465 [Micromonosporaceae bacterium]
MPDAPLVLDQIAQLLATTPCQHCGRPPYPVDERRPELDYVDDAERRLWRQVEEGAKVRAAAPPEPPAGKLESARKAMAQARRAARALHDQIDSAEATLADPRGWLRPGQRMSVAGQLSEDRNAVAPVQYQVAAAERRVRELEQRRDKRQAYLTRYRRVLEVSQRAQAELDQRIDELLHAYASQPVPPPWFGPGLGYPPTPDAYADWLRRARAVIAYRRRYGVDHPLEPLGRAVPVPGTPRHDAWRAAQR